GQVGEHPQPLVRLEGGAAPADDLAPGGDPRVAPVERELRRVVPPRLRVEREQWVAAEHLQAGPPGDLARVVDVRRSPPTAHRRATSRGRSRPTSTMNQVGSGDSPRSSVAITSWAHSREISASSTSRPLARWANVRSLA